jgi:hypothetical protein
MNKYTLLIILSLFSSLQARVVVSPLTTDKADLVDLYRRADKQRDLMHDLLSSSSNDDLRKLSVVELKKTIDDLDTYKERFIAIQNDKQAWGVEEKEHLLLVQELIRQLTTARREYDQRVKSSNAFRRVAIPVGSGIGIAALVKLADLILDLQLDNTTVLACGLVTSGVVGGVTFRDEISEGFGAVRDTVSQAWHNESWEDTATVLAALAGAAATGTILWKSYDLFMRNRPKKVGIEEMLDTLKT